MKRINILAVITLIVSFVTGIGFAAQQCTMLTNLYFAEMLARRLGIDAPVKTMDVSDEAYFASLANALSEKGIDNFSRVSPEDPVNFSEFVDVLYTVTGAKDNLDTSGEADYLIKNGYLASVKDMDSEVTCDDCESVLRRPSFDKLAATASSVPEVSTGRVPGSDVPGVNPGKYGKPY